MSLDFKRASDLFLGTEQELAMAVGLSLGDLRDYRQNPERAPEAAVLKLASALVERGRAMVRVGELLTE